MEYQTLIDTIVRLSESNNFTDSCAEITDILMNLTCPQCVALALEIGYIPENLYSGSKEEKLYSKTAEILLARLFQDLGLSACPIKKRGDCADVIAKSNYYNYSLVADAKAFRLSRTAKNQKDFKVSSLAQWKGDNDYAVLVCPYFQYPRCKSQIYKQALDNNVCLISWEFLAYLAENSCTESSSFSLDFIWNISKLIAQHTIAARSHSCFLTKQNKQFQTVLLHNNVTFEDFLRNQATRLAQRSVLEIEFYKRRIEQIQQYSRQQAVDELLSTLGLTKKIVAIEEFIRSLP